jgi:hypothetical protein
MPGDFTLAVPERNRYFYGLMMDAERFQKDQDYFNRKRFLLNRFVTGAGVVCGLDLNWDNTKQILMLKPGVAIDPAGREIIVPAATAIDVTQLTDAKGKPTGPAPAGATLLIELAFKEEKIDPVAVLVPDCDHPGACAPSAIEERFVVIVKVAGGPPPPIPGCVFGSFPLPPGAPLQQAIAKQIASDYSTLPADKSIALGRLDLSAGTLDAVSDRPIVYDNALLFQMIVCLAAQVQTASLVYVSGDNQSAGAGNALANPIVVGLVDGSGNPVTTGAAPVFAVSAGGGSLSAVTPAGPGQYQTTWTLGPAGAQTAKVTAAQSTLTVVFNATIAP